MPSPPGAIRRPPHVRWPTTTRTGLLLAWYRDQDPTFQRMKMYFCSVPNGSAPGIQNVTNCLRVWPSKRWHDRVVKVGFISKQCPNFRCQAPAPRAIFQRGRDVFNTGFIILLCCVAFRMSSKCRHQSQKMLGSSIANLKKESAFRFTTFQARRLTFFAYLS